MAEYYAVLSRAVASLEANTPETRRAVYDKARNALIAQLKAIVPPLPTSEISRQRLELEEAIRRAEREATNGAAAPPRAPTKRPSPAAAPPPQPAEPLRAEAEPPQAPPPRPEPVQPQVQQPPPQQPAPRAAPPQAPPPVGEAMHQAGEAGSHSPQEVFRRAIREAENRADSVPPPIERAPVREEAYVDPRAEFPVTDRPRRSPPPPEESGPYVPPDYHVPRRPEPEPEPEPRLAPDFPWEKEAPRPEPRTPRYAPPPQLDSDDQPVRIRDGRRKGGRDRGRDRERDHDVDTDFDDAAMQPSRLPTILLLVLIVALIGGLAALGWWQRGEIRKLMASFDGGPASNQQVASAPPPPPATDAAAGKNSDRLPGGNAIATTPGVRVVGETGSPADNGAPAAASTDTAAPAPPATATADAQPQPAAPQASGAALVAQKAVLYEEPLDKTKAANGVTQINAAVTWNYVANDANGPSVVANLDVPERGLKIRMTIHKNMDKTLPASHLIEVVVNTSAAFPGKSISAIPRLVLKPSEDARGQPLIGATAKVQDGLFWIALSALPSDIQNNMALLKDRDWIDLPLVYETGQRAILTFEKGTPGDRVLAEAMSAWGTG